MPIDVQDLHTKETRPTMLSPDVVCFTYLSTAECLERLKHLPDNWRGVVKTRVQDNRFLLYERAWDFKYTFTLYLRGILISDPRGTYVKADYWFEKEVYRVFAALAGVVLGGGLAMLIRNDEIARMNQSYILSFVAFLPLGIYGTLVFSTLSHKGTKKRLLEYLYDLLLVGDLPETSRFDLDSVRAIHESPLHHD